MRRGLRWGAGSSVAALAAAASGGSVFVSDSFTDTAGVLLSAHIGETGADWTNHSSYGDGAVISDANRARGVSSSRGLYPSGTPNSADYEVESVMFVKSLVAGVTFSIGARFSTTQNRGYLFRYNNADGRWDLVSMTDGTQTVIGTNTSATLSVDTAYTMRLRVQGTSIKGFVNDVEVADATDATYSAAGVPFLRFNGNASDTTNFHADSFEAVNL